MNQNPDHHYQCSSSSPIFIGIPIAFQFSQATYTVTRGEAAELVITTGTILTFNASVTLMATGGNATAGTVDAAI